MNNQIVLLFLIILVITIAYSSLKEKYNNFSYAQLGRNYNSHLESPYFSSRCAGGPYMYTSNPDMQAKCSSVTDKECGTGYHGKPVHFSYSPITSQNSSWGNSLCDTPTPSSLLVL